MGTRLIATPLLKQTRQELGYKQEEMAQVLTLVMDENISPSLYQKWEQGSKTVSMQQAVVISRELGTDLKDLWTNKK